MRVIITAKNNGNAPAYHSNMTMTIAQGVTLLADMMPADLVYTTATVGTDTVLTLNTLKTIEAGGVYSIILYVKFVRSSSGRLLTASSSSLTIIKSVSAKIDLT